MALPDDFVEYPSIPYPNQILQADTHVYQYDAAKKTWRVLNPTWDYYATFATLDFGTSTYVDLKAVVASYSPDTLTDRYGNVRDIPQRNISGNYTFKRVDSGKHLYRPQTSTGAVTWTVPDNSSVPFPIGAAITIINDTATVSGTSGLDGAIWIAAAGSTIIRSFGTATTRVVTTNSSSPQSATVVANTQRALAACEVATLVKVGLDLWHLR